MKVLIGDEAYDVIREVYDPFYDCYLYYVAEFDEPFYDSDEGIEIIYDREDFRR